MTIPVCDNAYADSAPSYLVTPLDLGAWRDYAPSTLVIHSDDQAWRDVPPAAQWALPATVPTQDIYVCELRADGLPAVEVPMDNCQMRRRDGQPTFVLAVIPDAVTYEDIVTPYKDGTIIIRAGVKEQDGTRHLSELTRVSFDSLAVDTGVKNSSLSISGYSTHSNTNPRGVTLSSIIYYGRTATGKTRIRCPVDLFLRPGDTATFSPYGSTSESFVVESITVNIDTRNRRMEVSGT